ncbi:hypothetical protein C8F04DRAFT_1174519 [Mycena alexandri]|uniref:Uncharacterized protein n=1 Tax=Mycena alexandri TaxID=1745969 RepID=A0AAD6XE97_9AGAR|nr:hypothetical protein C8F04DRAFT_1174519 [Mycena alexandri]
MFSALQASPLSLSLEVSLPSHWHSPHPRRARDLDTTENIASRGDEDPMSGESVRCLRRNALLKDIIEHVEIASENEVTSDEVARRSRAIIIAQCVPEKHVAKAAVRSFCSFEQLSGLLRWKASSWKGETFLGTSVGDAGAPHHCHSPPGPMLWKWGGEERATRGVQQQRGGQGSIDEGDVQLEERERVFHGHEVGYCRGCVPSAVSRGAVYEDKVESSDLGHEVADDGGDALTWDGVCLGFVAIEAGKELLRAWIAGGVLDEFLALRSVFPRITVVHRYGEGIASSDEMSTNVRDSSELTNEGCISAADVEVAEDDRKNNFQPVTTDEEPLGHRDHSPHRPSTMSPPPGCETLAKELVTLVQKEEAKESKDGSPKVWI